MIIFCVIGLSCTSPYTCRHITLELKHLMAGCEIPHQLSVFVFLRALQWLPVSMVDMDHMPAKNVTAMEKLNFSLSLLFRICFTQSLWEQGKAVDCF